MRFVKENINPLEKKTSDCVIRAIAKATGMNWLTIFDSLTKIAREKYSVLNADDVYFKYLKNLETGTCQAVKGRRRDRVKDFSLGTYILKTANHLTCVIDGVNYDTFDNRERCVYRFWRF